MSLSYKDRQRYAHILSLMEKDKPKKENKIEVRYPVSILLFGSFYAFWCVIMSVFHQSVLILLIVLVFAYVLIDYGRKPYFVILDDNGVKLPRKKREFLWEEIDYLSIEETIHGWWCRNSRTTNLWCVLTEGEEVKVNLSIANFSASELYVAITQQFPQVRCYPPE